MQKEAERDRSEISVSRKQIQDLQVINALVLVLWQKNSERAYVCVFHVLLSVRKCFWSKSVLYLRMYSPPSTCVLPLLMQAKCDSLQESLTHAVEKSKTRKQLEQIMVQQMNVRSGLVRARVCVYVLPSLSTCVHKSLILVVHTHLHTYVRSSSIWYFCYYYV